VKALRIDTPGSLSVSTVEPPLLTAGEVLLKLHYVGFCGSDLSSFRGKNPLVVYPVVPGHEISAVVVETGPGVPDDIKVGTSCTVNPYTACGKCASCAAERPNACAANQTLGVQRHGAMQEYLTVPFQKVILAPQLGALELAMVEPLSVGYHAVQRARLQSGETVLLLGLGMIGVGVLFAALIQGARVIVVDKDPEKLAQALRWGAELALNADDPELEKKIQAENQGRGPQVVIEAVGIPRTYTLAIRSVAFAGRVVYIGYALPDVAFETRWFVQKELDIRGSRNALPEDFSAVINYLSTGQFPIRELISKLLTPEEAPAAMQQWSENPGDVFRMLVRWS
jgi:2-desacetyl-2-hydroxyethyl bacteriochlorophyllide A dehydrogenase